MINVLFLSNFSRLQPKRVFQTVKNLNLMRQQRSSLAPSPLNIPGSNQTSCFTSGRSSRVGSPRCNSIFGSETGGGIILDNRTRSTLDTPDNGYGDHALQPRFTDFKYLFFRNLRKHNILLILFIVYQACGRTLQIVVTKQ